MILDAMIRTMPALRRARPILWMRDYDAAKQLVRQALIQLDDERLLALLRELADFERARPVVDLGRIVEWAECVFVPVIAFDGRSSRRWSDCA
jgi:hypothetical protein